MVVRIVLSYRRFGSTVFIKGGRDLEKVLNKTFYSAYGLIISSELPLNGFEKIENYNSLIQSNPSSVDVEIVIEDLTQQWSKLGNESNNFVIKDDFILFHMPEVVIYRIAKGRQLAVSPLSNEEMSKINLYINGYCMSLLLLQRGILPLHGSAVVWKDKAYALIGFSGAGKSTLARSLINRGCSFLTDDIIPIQMDSNSKTASIIPGFPEQLLWDTSMDGFQMEKSGNRIAYDRTNTNEQYEKNIKYAVKVPQFLNTNVPLGGIFEIMPAASVEEVGIYPLTKMKQLQALILHTFNRTKVPQMNAMDWHFKYVTELLKITNVYRGKRSTSTFVCDDSKQDLAATIIEWIEGENDNGKLEFN